LLPRNELKQTLPMSAICNFLEERDSKDDRA
jgi:hypothetical protein